MEHQVSASAARSVLEGLIVTHENPFRTQGAEPRINIYEQDGNIDYNYNNIPGEAIEGEAIEGEAMEVEAREDEGQSMEETQLRHWHQVIIERDPRVTFELIGNEVRLTITADRDERCHQESWEPDAPICNKCGRKPDTPGTRIYAARVSEHTHSIWPTYTEAPALVPPARQPPPSAEVAAETTTAWLQPPTLHRSTTATSSRSTQQTDDATSLVDRQSSAEQVYQFRTTASVAQLAEHSPAKGEVSLVRVRPESIFFVRYRKWTFLPKVRGDLFTMYYNIPKARQDRSIGKMFQNFVNVHTIKSVSGPQKMVLKKKQNIHFDVKFSALFKSEIKNGGSHLKNRFLSRYSFEVMFKVKSEVTIGLPVKKYVRHSTRRSSTLRSSCDHKSSSAVSFVWLNRN
ncbi:unnamed protein product [Trichogramma brassicae]|uniref:Uncharacterized protein n=1 Tax=Trichogramma brassicae TaxID=86971 RepID=A0A6H5IG14_9HYME|nr:unnamed protein product [Trichogramma brassicae]